MLMMLVSLSLFACVQTELITEDGQLDITQEQADKLIAQGEAIYAEYQRKKEAAEEQAQVESPEGPAEEPAETPEDEVEVPKKPVTPATGLTKEVIEMHGRYNGDRPTFYAARNLNQYPPSFFFTVPGCIKRTGVTTNGKRLEYGGYLNWIFKQSDVSYRGMGIVGPTACKGTKLVLEY